jgi:hypothetical protein
MCKYNPEYLSDCKSYKEEKRALRILILANPADVKLLKDSCHALTGVRFRKKTDE